MEVVTLGMCLTKNQTNDDANIAVWTCDSDYSSCYQAKHAFISS